MNDQGDPSAVDELVGQETTEIQTGEDGTLDGQKAPDKPAVDLEKALADLATHVQTVTAPKPVAAPEMTEAEKREFWAVYDPAATRKDFFQKWFRLNPEATEEEKKEVQEMWADVQKGIVRQAVTGSRNIMSNELAKLREEFGPMVEYVQTARAEATRGRFHEQYPALEDAKFKDVLQAVARTLDNREFRDEDEYFKVLAESTAATLKKLIPEFDLGAVIEKKPTGTRPRLPRSSVGGGGGAGKGATSQTPQSSRRNAIDELVD